MKALHLMFAILGTLTCIRIAIFAYGDSDVGLFADFAFLALMNIGFATLVFSGRKQG